MALENIVGKLGTLASGASSVGAITSALGAVGNLLGIGGDSTKKQKELSKYQADLEQQQWLERFNLQNEYNSPEAARKRLQAAGLNENLVYGNLSPNLTAANPHTNNPASSVSKFMTKAELAQMAAQSSAMASEAALKQKENMSLQEDIERKRMENEITRSNLEELKEREHYITLTHKRVADRTFEETETEKVRQEHYRREYIREDARIANWIDYEAQHIALRGKELGLQAEQLRIYAAQTNAMIRNLAAQTSYVKTLEGGVRISNAKEALPLMLGRVFSTDSKGNLIYNETLATDNLEDILNGMWFDNQGNAFVPYSALFAIQAYNQGSENLKGSRFDTVNKKLDPYFKTAGIVTDILKTGAQSYSQMRFAESMKKEGKISFTEMLRESKARKTYDNLHWQETNENLYRNERGLPSTDYFPSYKQ